MWSRSNMPLSLFIFSDSITMKIVLHGNCLSQRGSRPVAPSRFVYRDCAGWPASLPYVRKFHISVVIYTQSTICLHKRVPTVKIWGSSKNDQNWTMRIVAVVVVVAAVVVVVLQFQLTYLKNG